MPAASFAAWRSLKRGAREQAPATRSNPSGAQLSAAVQFCFRCSQQPVKIQHKLSKYASAKACT